VSELRRPEAAEWTNRRKAGTKPSQTGARLTGSVSPEGGGTAIPTLGGGCAAMAGAGAAGMDTAT